MVISVASGKGGTGKTTVSTNLAVVASMQGLQASYLDCDVEEPNGHLFLNPSITDSRTVNMLVPVVDSEKCILCGKCAEICVYNAIVALPKSVLTFPELCHACGGCSRICPVGAISEKPKPVGTVEVGTAKGVRFVHGRLNIGEVMSPPIIREVKKLLGQDLEIVDAPPGTSCPVIETLKESDFVVLVTEPTPFGLNDLGLAIDTVRELGLPHGVVVNRADDENDLARRFCREKQVEILAEIPEDRRVAEAYSRGELVVEALPEYAAIFHKILEKIRVAGGRP